MARGRPEPRRLLRRVLTVACATAALALVPTMSASAHPLGNFTINHYNGLVVSPTGIVDHAVIDAAELPTIQQRDSVDTDGDKSVSAAERGAFADAECPRLAGQLELRVNGVVQTWTVGASDFSYRAGAAGLDTSRLECELSVDADLSTESTIDFRDGYLSDRVGWREITASGARMTLRGSGVGSRSISDELRSYPNALLSSPLDERAVSMSAAPGASTRSTTLPDIAPVGWTARLLGEATATLDGLVGGSRLTLPVGLLAVLLSLVLGASHAALPGHGKTIMAAYMVGTRGTPKDAFLIGVTVTLAHTTGVLVLGALFSASATFAGESLLAILGVVSGALVAAIGVGLLRGAVRRRGGTPSGTRPAHGHSHGHGHAPDHWHSHDHRADPAPQDASISTVPRSGSSAVATLLPEGDHHHVHAPDGGDAMPAERHGHELDPAHARSERGFRRLTLVGMGLAGGLVPSPSALIVLLGAISLGRTAFGVLLVVGYGIGMAATLILVGYLIARMPSRLAGVSSLAGRPILGRVIANGPVLTACLVLVVGLGLALRSASPFL